MPGFALFETSLGTAAVAWRAEAIIAVELPHADPDRTRAALQRYRPDAVEQSPPPWVAEVITRIARLLRDGREDLRDVPVALAALPPFQREVYEFVRSLGPGEWTTYGRVAEALGIPGGAQAVGQAMGHNPVPIIVPCHRVVAAGGKLGGFSAPGGAGTKRRMLMIEETDLPQTQPALF
jgi:methylated-DNA-[protein]-cysteine S-methyltransferase